MISSHSSLLLDKIYHFVYVSLGGHLGWSHTLPIVNGPAINVAVQVFLCWADLYTWLYIQ